jgi:5-methylcytosine-specific restriction endonuclease McrA
MSLKACIVCAAPCETGRCPRHPAPRSPSSVATSKWAHRKARARMLKAGDLVCWICGRAIAPDDMQVDHILPVSKGGEHGATAPSHASCNASRGAGKSRRSPPSAADPYFAARDEPSAGDR